MGMVRARVWDSCVSRTQPYVKRKQVLFAVLYNVYESETAINIRYLTPYEPVVT
jgi:hypothetical protein